MKNRHTLLRLLPAVLLASGFAIAAAAAHAADRATAHVDGYLLSRHGCLILRQHDGTRLSLVGGTAGLRDSDHVRLEGQFVPDPGCGAQGFAVSEVQTLWGDDNHRTTVYDHLSGEPFGRFAERTGRYDERGGRAGRGDERREAERRAYERESAERGAPAYVQDEPPERPDRNGHYVYHGPHHRVTLVGKIHEDGRGCATLETSHAVFALDGNIADYQAGDRVSVSGMLYDQDPGAPCGAPTVIIRSIHGRG
jgi:hypothetical protein